MSFAVNYAVMSKGWRQITLMHKECNVAAIHEDGT